jgi:methionyl-tRNA synthetase
LQEGLRLAREVNAYLDQAPWFSVIKEDKQSAARTVYTAIKAIDSLKILLAPFLPHSSEQLHRFLGYDQPLFGEQQIATYQEEARQHQALIYDGSKATGAWQPSQLAAGHTLREPKPLYQKLDPEVVEQERSRLGE